jgi:hypothetical protein
MCRVISLITAVLFVVAAVMAMTLAFAGTAYAQTGHTTPAATPATSTDTVQGTEFSAGTIEGDTRFGASFAGEATGNLPGVLVATADYTPPSPGPNTTKTSLKVGEHYLASEARSLAPLAVAPCSGTQTRRSPI